MSDNDSSSTRIGFKGQHGLDNGLTASVLIEYELAQNASDGDLFVTAPSTSANLVERHARFGLSGDFGSFYVGHTSSALDGIAETDLLGVGNILYSSITSIGGSSSFVQKSGVTSSATIYNIF